MLDAKASHHLSVVLRCRVGDECFIFDGHGREIKVVIAEITKAHVVVRFLEEIVNESESALHVHLAQAVGKGEKMDWVVQKATELGVAAITPLWTDYSEVKLSSERLAKKMQHWQNIMISAAEQCGRAVLPLLHTPQCLTDLIIPKHALLCSPRGGKLSSALFSDSVQLLIGPEGGFSTHEEAWAIQQGASMVELGKRVLRTETAAIAAITAVQVLRGDL